MSIAFQIILNSLIAGLLLSLVAIGFAYIFQITKVFHLAHAAVYVVGAYAYWWAGSMLGHWAWGVLAALVIVSLLAVVLEKAVYLSLDRQRTDQSITLIASMGSYVVLINLVAMLFGNENKVPTEVAFGSFDIQGIVVTYAQCIQLGVSVLVLLVMFWVLKKSQAGLQLKAAADSALLSQVLGIDTVRMRLRVFIGGSMLVAVAGILRTIEVGIDPQAGMGITLTAVVVAVMVGRMHIGYLLAFGIGLTLLQNTIEWYSNSQWRDGLTFLLLLLVVLFRTEGVISYQLRKDNA